MGLGPRPTIYEIHTAVWLGRLGGGSAGPLTLAEVPAAEWDRIASLPVDAVWLMGVWERSPIGRQMAIDDPDISAGNRAVLADLSDDDVIGSPYCVHAYTVDARFGGPAGLAAARAALADRGIGLVLDFVPNHVAPDHPWLGTHPEYFIHGSRDDLAADPAAYLETPGGIVARGRDPYFPPWPDVVQLNAFAPELRVAVANTLVGIAAQCDAVRCDMAMLAVNEVFARTWGSHVGVAPAEEYWPQIIGAVRSAAPGFTFIAEAYWDMEPTLQSQGFDYCYDKRLYDRLVHDTPASVRAHLAAGADEQEHRLRFVENHDEPRAAATFGYAQLRAVTVVMSTLQGARLYYDGQLEASQVRVPVFLSRGPDEAPDPVFAAFAHRLLAAISVLDIHTGDWALVPTSGWPDNPSHEQLVSWTWTNPRGRHLVVVNLSDRPAQARVHPPWAGGLIGSDWDLHDLLCEEVYRRDGDELAVEGLYVELPGWGAHLLTIPGDG
jgi:hypothetical protein